MTDFITVPRGWIALTGFDSARIFHLRISKIDGVGVAPDCTMVEKKTQELILKGATQIYCSFGRLQVRDTHEDVMQRIIQDAEA